MIKKAVKEDITCVAEMASIMWEDASLEELKTEFEKTVEKTDCVVYIYYFDDVPIGFAQCGLRHDYVEGTNSTPVGYLEGLFIREEYRKMGYAKQLLDKCEKWAKEKGCSEFASDCELKNDVSFNFHMNVGFMETNRIICFKKKI